jgi:hypothetical protein
MSGWIAKMYDGEGNEIIQKPGHVTVWGKESFMQIPINTYEAKMVYKDPVNSERAKKLICEWGSTDNILFPTSDGSLKTWDILNEEIPTHIDGHGTENP